MADRKEAGKLRATELAPATKKRKQAEDDIIVTFEKKAPTTPENKDKVEEGDDDDAEYMVEEEEAILEENKEGYLFIYADNKHPIPQDFWVPARFMSEDVLASLQEMHAFSRSIKLEEHATENEKKEYGHHAKVCAEFVDFLDFSSNPRFEPIPHGATVTVKQVFTFTLDPL